MYLEHLTFSIAIALAVSLVFYSNHAGYSILNPAWIIVIMGVFPDIDWVIMKAELLFQEPPLPMIHGDWHNFMAVAFFSLVVAFLFTYVGVPFITGLICSAVGYSSHLFLDMVSSRSYNYVWPFKFNLPDIGIIPHRPDFFFFANIQPLLFSIGLIVMLLVITTFYSKAGVPT